MFSGQYVYLGYYMRLGIIWLQDTIGFQDIYRERDSKWLLDGMGIWDSKCDWDILWLQDTIGFWDIYRKIDDK